MTSQTEYFSDEKWIPYKFDKMMYALEDDFELNNNWGIHFRFSHLIFDENALNSSVDI